MKRFSYKITGNVEVESETEEEALEEARFKSTINGGWDILDFELEQNKGDTIIKEIQKKMGDEEEDKEED